MAPKSEIRVRAQFQGFAMSRGKWSQPGVPHKGWYLVEFEDLGSPDETCQMCESMSIRYVHHMEHRDYPEVLGVGRVCASNMEEDYTAARKREKRAANRAKRRAKWMSTEWNESMKGNHYINRQGFNIVLFSRFDGWAYRITDRETEESWPAFRFGTEEDAKAAAFERFMMLLDS